VTSSVQNGGPPHDLDAEVGLLGSILLDPDAARRVRDLVEADDFYREHNGTIFRAALNLLEDGEPIDPTTVGGELARMGFLDRVGGRAHLWQLREVVPTAAIAEHSARMVRELATLRRVGAQALEVAKAAHDRKALDALGDHVDLLRETAAREAAWQPPLPLADAGALPEFPLEALPGWCAAYAAAVAEATQTPRDLAGMIVLASLATCAGGRARVEIKSGWEEPLNLYLLVALLPGERKSAVFEAVTSPLSEFEEERAQALAPVVTEAAIRRRALDRAAEKAETEAANAKTAEAREAGIRRAAQLAMEAESVIVPAPYRLLADDATPEILASLLAQQGGRIALLSPEGGVVGQMAGRYSASRVAGANLGVYLKGHAGDRLRIDRVGRASEYVPRPALTIGLAVQPEVLRTMADVPELGGLGVLARFLYSVPRSLMGDRTPDPDPVPAELAHEYAFTLMLLARNIDAAGRPWAIPFTAPSRRLLIEYSAALEPRLGETGDLRYMRDWAGKLPGAHRASGRPRPPGGQRPQCVGRGGGADVGRVSHQRGQLRHRACPSRLRPDGRRPPGRTRPAGAPLDRRRRADRVQPARRLRSAARPAPAEGDRSRSGAGLAPCPWLPGPRRHVPRPRPAEHPLSRESPIAKPAEPAKPGCSAEFCGFCGFCVRASGGAMRVPGESPGLIRLLRVAVRPGLHANARREIRRTRRTPLAVGFCGVLRLW
jgi:hypothetical protein